MTKFEELQEIIARKKNKIQNQKKSELDNDDDNLVEVAGGEGSKTPLLECGDDQTDPDLLDQLHFKAKYKPNSGSGVSWDSDW